MGLGIYFFLHDFRKCVCFRSIFCFPPPPWQALWVACLGSECEGGLFLLLYLSRSYRLRAKSQLMILQLIIGKQNPASLSSSVLKFHCCGQQEWSANAHTVRCSLGGVIRGSLLFVSLIFGDILLSEELLFYGTCCFALQIGLKEWNIPLNP